MRAVEVDAPATRAHGSTASSPARGRRLAARAPRAWWRRAACWSTAAAPRGSAPAGHEVEVDCRSRPPRCRRPSTSVPSPIRLEDEHLLVVDKPAGRRTHPAPGAAGDAGARAAGAAGRRRRRPGARASCTGSTATRPACWWSPARRGRTARRPQAAARGSSSASTSALVHGRPPAAPGTHRGADRPRPAAPRADGGGRPARPRRSPTSTLSEALPGFTLLACGSRPGRTHQIRVHLAAIGHPVVGDPTYGPGAPTGSA